MAPRQSIRPLGHRLFQYKRSSRQSAKTSRNRENNPLGSQTNPAHVLNHDTPRGWAVIQKAVDDFDNDEIEGVKSDMDTLLVFNGLFSAVLSAFFVIAIALLQEDIPGATLMTLRQMSAQNANYTIQGNFIHSISPAPTSSPPFEPTANAIRINGLWTASLAISLITASFAILVKQWLREYMKFVTSFPQGRLRIRKFRRAGLKTWKVLTIAACLPLLLQLALGLFFIGLCFYTADLHSSVRNTTLPLVAGWGFIFFFVTVSPLFSDHCPYKTPALDSLVVALRRSVRNRWKVLLQSMCNHARRIIWDSSLRGRMADAVFRWAEKHHDHLNSPAEPYDEVTAAKHEAGDLDIMADADELQGNDEILGTAMVDALQLITAPPEGIIGFVLKILQHRVPWEGSFKSSPQIIDCSMATTRTLDSVHSILKQHLRINDVLIPSDTNFELGPVASWTAALYLSLWTHRRFENLQAPLWEAFNMKPEVFAKVAVSVLSAPGLRALLHLTCHSCRESKFDLAQSLARIKFAVEPFFGKLGLTDSFESGNDDAPWQDVLNGESLRDAVAFLIDLLRDDTAAQDDEWSDTQLDTLSLIVKLIAVRPWQFGDSPGAVQRMTLSSKSDAAVVKLVTLLIKSYPGSLLWYTNHDEFYLNIDALSRFTTAIDAIATTSPDHLTRLSVLKVCESLTWGVYYGRDKIIGCASARSWDASRSRADRHLHLLPFRCRGAERGPESQQ
ncbi:hypothetical protein BDW22DRAFT_1099076 [Trametopsis cervina]|nr:hypothetical protein BDW22DRAFT_1099076 [Trametopsis cervina]